jgi:hypothetical protein
MFTNRHNDGRLRVSGGVADRSLFRPVAVALFRPVVLALLVLFALAGTAFAAGHGHDATIGIKTSSDGAVPSINAAAEVRTVVVPSVLMNGYWSERVTLNPTDAAIDLPTTCRVGPCSPERVAPRSVLKKKRADYGTDIETVTADARLQFYVKVWTPLGHYAVVPPLSLLSGLTYLYDLSPAAEFESYVWIAVEPGQEGRYVTIEDHGVPRENDFGRRELQAYELGRGAIIERVWGPTVKIHLGALPGWPALPAPSGIYVFAFDVHKATGAVEAQVAE